MAISKVKPQDRNKAVDRELFFEVAAQAPGDLLGNLVLASLADAAGWQHAKRIVSASNHPGGEGE
jgi:hypothetical protein